MAKKKASNSTSTISPAASHAAPPNAANAKAVNAKAAVAKSSLRPMTDEDIGIVAGEIWHLLSAGGSQTLTAVKKSIDAQSDLVAAAVGWLAREGKLEFVKSGRTVKLTLR